MTIATEVETAVAAVAPVIAKVISKNGYTLFEGLLADAETFIANHFPRQHVNDGAEPEADYRVETTQDGNKVDVPVAKPNSDLTTAPASAAPAAPVSVDSSELDALKATVAQLSEELANLTASNAGGQTF